MNIYFYAYSITLLTFSRVRSFDNARQETIQFHTPLTLIVGYNGSGKTVRMSHSMGTPTDMVDRLLSNVSSMPRQGIFPQIAKEGLSYRIRMYVVSTSALQIHTHSFVAMRREGRSRTGQDVVQRHYRSEDGN